MEPMIDTCLIYIQIASQELPRTPEKLFTRFNSWCVDLRLEIAEVRRTGRGKSPLVKDIGHKFFCSSVKIGALEL
jgi:hypothetical protein